jgi:hypothetical protein
MDWYYASNGQQAGPVSQEQLAELFRNGTVKPFDLVWNETMTEWTPIGKLSDFALSSPPAAASPVHQGFPPLETPPPMSSPMSAPMAAATAPAPGLAPAGMAEPPNYLWQSIVVTVLCCLPFGIPAIIFSTKVKPAFQTGDYAAAADASKKAKLWCIIALIVGLVVNILVFIAQFAFAFTAAAAPQSYQ